jgi:hypothetical protein
MSFVLGSSSFVRDLDVVQVQTQHAQKAYEAYTSEMSKLGEMYMGVVRNASKRVEEASRGR